MPTRYVYKHTANVKRGEVSSSFCRNIQHGSESMVHGTLQRTTVGDGQPARATPKHPHPLPPPSPQANALARRRTAISSVICDPPPFSPKLSMARAHALKRLCRQPPLPPPQSALGLPLPTRCSSSSVYGFVYGSTYLIRGGREGEGEGGGWDEGGGWCKGGGEGGREGKK